jgi:hypothetical protein
MMMPHTLPEARQDTIPVKNIQHGDSAGLKSDTASLFTPVQPKDTLHHRLTRPVSVTVPGITDTISVCSRNSIRDVTFYDSVNLVTSIDPIHKDKFPFLFTAKGKLIMDEAKTSLVKHLRPGEEIPYRPLHEDWLILILICAAYLFAMIRKSSGNILHGAERFFLFRGINEATSRDIGGLFTWESTIKNLTAFLILGLFVYSVAAYHDLLPAAIPGMLIWLILVIIVITSITLRHIICLVTGTISDEREVFTEYILSIYQFYRFSAIFLFVVTLLMAYTTIFQVESYITMGVIILATLYLIRVMRLFIIFINKNISLFYLILYLCALEILPVVILIKYISGLA